MQNLFFFCHESHESLVAFCKLGSDFADVKLLGRGFKTIKNGRKKRSLVVNVTGKCVGVGTFVTWAQSACVDVT